MGLIELNLDDEQQYRRTAMNKKLTVDNAAPLKRRGWLLGAGAAGAAVLAVKVMPAAVPAAPAVEAVQALSVESGGYQVTPHVLRYYETTRC
jgi:hypothetical protein